MKKMNYEKMFNDVIETLSEALEELQTQYENIKDELNEAVKGGELDEQIKSLQELSTCFGKMKMLNDIRCLMTEMKGESEIERKARVTQLEGQYLDTGITQGIV
jgi:hypothetical protein